MDSDGSGAISFDEFKRSMDMFGIDMTDLEVARLIQLLDSNGDGELDFDEFSTIAKAEIEMLDVEDMLKNSPADFGTINGAKEIAMAAAHAGVRFTRTASVCGNMKKQGCAEMLNPESLRAREAIKQHDAVARLIRSWWTSVFQLAQAVEVENNKYPSSVRLPKRSASKKEALTKEQYITLSVSLHEMLDPSVSDAEAKATALGDWDNEMGAGANTMDYRSFFESMYEIDSYTIDSCTIDSSMIDRLCALLAKAEPNNEA
jgi:hypothetical protein